jgi:hypothetical protein
MSGLRNPVSSPPLAPVKPHDIRCGEPQKCRHLRCPISWCPFMPPYKGSLRITCVAEFCSALNGTSSANTTDRSTFPDSGGHEL